MDSKLLVLLALCALAYARPELYKEKEDFKYSRSSSDEGSKSGFYSAQNGNMGENYEKAHNMDHFANNQLDTVRHGVHGSLSQLNLDHAGSSFGIANARGSHNGYAGLSGGYNQQYRNKGYGSQYSSDYSNSESQKENINGQGDNFYYRTNTPTYGQNYHNHYNNQLRDTETLSKPLEKGYESSYNYKKEWEKHHGGADVQVSPLSVPVSDFSEHGSQHHDQFSTFNQQHQGVALDPYENEFHHANNYGQNLRDTESLSKPLEKGYESQYNYRKEWEKHHGEADVQVPSLPLSIPVTDFSGHGSQHHDAVSNINHQHQGIASGQYGSQNYRSEWERQQSQNYLNRPIYSQRVQSDVEGHGLNKEYEKVEEAKYKKEWEKHYGTQNHEALALTNQKALGSILDEGITNVQEIQPKKFQSAYSYHKEWERHGDPYVIKPVPEKLVDDC